MAVGLRALVRPPKPKAPTTDPKPPSIGRSFLAGAGGMASNLTTFALYTPALALIAGSGLLLRQQGLAALVILLITLMVAWVPLVLAAVVPGASTRLLPWLGGWMTANNRWIQVILGFGFGIWLLVKGVNACKSTSPHHPPGEAALGPPLDAAAGTPHPCPEGRHAAVAGLPGVPDAIQAGNLLPSRAHPASRPRRVRPLGSPSLAVVPVIPGIVASRPRIRSGSRRRSLGQKP